MSAKNWTLLTGQRTVAAWGCKEDKFKLSADFSFLCSTEKSVYNVLEGSARRRSASWRDKVGSDTFYGHKGTGKTKTDVTQSLPF